MSKRSADEAKLERFDGESVKRLDQKHVKQHILEYCRKHRAHPAMIADMMMQIRDIISYHYAFDLIDEEPVDVFVAFLKAGSILSRLNNGVYKEDVIYTHINNMFVKRIEVAEDSPSDCDKWVDFLFGSESVFHIERYSHMHYGLRQSNEDDTISVFKHIFDSTIHYKTYLHVLRRIAEKPWMCQVDSDSSPDSMRVDLTSRERDENDYYRVFLRMEWYSLYIGLLQRPIKYQSDVSLTGRGVINSTQVSEFILKLFESCKLNYDMERHVVTYLPMILRVVGKRDLKAMGDILDTILSQNERFLHYNKLGEGLERLMHFYSPEFHLAVRRHVGYIPFHRSARSEMEHAEFFRVVDEQSQLESISEGVLDQPVVEEKIKPFIDALYDNGFPDLIINELVLNEYNILYGDSSIQARFATEIGKIVAGVVAQRRSAARVTLAGRLSDMSIRR